MEQLSWVNTVVGDPLMTWKQLLPGDINMDGKVDISDLALLGANWGKTVAAGGYGWTMGDLNGDGVVNIGDLAILGADWGQVSSWATGSVNTQGVTASNIVPAPEPSGFVMAVIGVASIVGFRLRRFRHDQTQASAS
jgi:hypothetical protein